MPEIDPEEIELNILVYSASNKRWNPVLERNGSGLPSTFKVRQARRYMDSRPFLKFRIVTKSVDPDTGEQIIISQRNPREVRVYQH